ncbi:MAG: restriction endonuclease subunit S [Nanohaloarchaea archaeon]|nr:restriction endonuclease subunit S [Candidatus Nanohaloarchaea archaeon]
MSNQASLGDISGSGSSGSDQEKESKDLETKEDSFVWKNVAEEWSLVDGTKIFEVNPSYDAEGEITYIGMDNLQTELPYPSIEGIRDADDYSGKLFTEDDVIFPRITPCTENGKRAIIEDIDTEYGIGSTEFIVLSPDQDKLVPWYLFYLVNSYVVRDYAISRMRGSTGRQRVPYSVFRNELDVALPPKDEQRRIASVLYNMDQAISKTEEIIEQTQRVKKGLMQDLFTEGYYSHEEFEDSRFAKYPEEWDSKQVRDLIDEGVIEKIMDGNHGERHPTSEDFIEEGIPFVTSDAVWNSHVDWENAKKISEETYENLRKGFAEPGDVLLTHKGSVGRVGRVPEDKEKVMLSPQVTYYRINDEETLDPEYLKYFFRSSFCQKEMAGHSQQSTRDYIGLTKQKTLKIHVPKIEEQRKIADALNSMDQKIEREKEEKEELQRLKKGLMQDLLTGSVRTGEDVRVLDEVVEVEG